jgi:large subunit ribosomal protein L24
MKARSHVRKGDLVVVISGSSKGKRGKVLKVLGDRVIVEKVALVKRHSKATQQNPQGGIVEKEGTVHISNVLLWDEKLSRGTRTKIQTGSKDGDQKVRVGVKSGTEFPNAGMG